MPRILLTLFMTTIFIVAAGATSAQSTRPRRVKPPDTLLGPEPTPAPATDKNAPLLDVRPTKPVGDAPVPSDTTHAYQLFQQKHYADAAKEARQIARADPTNAEAWIQHMLRSTAAGTPGTKSSTVTGDFRRSSFSSERICIPCNARL